MNAIYARVSTEDQVKTGYSLTDQINTCREKLLSMFDDDVKEYVDEGYSGEFWDRPALDKLRSDILTGTIKNVMILDPDRLSRNMAHTLMLKEEFEKNGSRLYFINGSYDNTPEGDLFFKIRASIASFEKAKTRERTMRGKKAKALEGKVVLYRPKYGYDWDPKNSTYIVNNDQAQIVRLIYSLCINEGKGLHRITKELNSRGLKNGHGRPFHFRYIYRILIDEAYYGEYHMFREQWVKTGQKTYDVTKIPKEQQIIIPIPAIISKEEHEQARRQLEMNLSEGRRNRQRDYLLTGIIKCGLCGKGMVAVPFKNRRLLYYICHGTRVLKNCKSAYVPLNEIENEVWNQIILLAQGKLNFVQPQIVDKSNEISELNKKALDLKQTQDNITNLVFENLIDNESAKKKLKQIVKELSEIKSTVTELENIQKSSIRELPTINLTDVLNAETILQKHDLIKNAGLKIIAYKERGQETRFDIEF